MRKLSLTFAFLASGCASLPHVPLPNIPFVGNDARTSEVVRASIAEDVTLTLPVPPGFPETRTVVQTGHARYGETEAAFDAILSLSPERVDIVITVPAGPRLATITWDEAGVSVERSVIAPDNLPAENMLADLFIAAWPVEAVAAALPAGLQLDVGADGQRTISRGGEIIFSVIPDASNAARTLVRNEAFGYEVTVIRQSVEP